MTTDVLAVAGPSSPSDEELVRRMQFGDAEALGALYARHQRKAHRIAGAVCRDTGHAQEVVQEAFISIWRSRATYQPARGDVGAWTMRIVRNRAIAVARHNGAIENRRDDVAALGSRADAVDVSECAERRERSIMLRMALRRLPAAQSEVVALAFYNGLSHDEIARRLQLPAGTVKGRIRLGLQRLRRELPDI
ncbi:MAG: sigma-70 family RNA polymerase sigma factor [Solirubrobacteraceae bacterium]